MSKDCLILDGGLATELERAGYDLDHPLWSAKLLLGDREAIKKVHRSYLEAGAECIITSSYQLSYPGCSALGISEHETTELLIDSVRVAIEARQEFGELSESTGHPPDPASTKHIADRKTNAQNTIVVAASIGPYGAYLADGSEYSGKYGLSKEELRAFHKKRFDVLAATDADILACETIPSLLEAEVLLELLESTPARTAWFSFSCRNGERINDGTPIGECASLLANSNQVEAIGINCTAPQHISDLIRRIRKSAPSKTVIVYPNSGESYDARSGMWLNAQADDPGASGPGHFGGSATEWFAVGARMIGGCCRTGPEDIRRIREELRDQGCES